MTAPERHWTVRRGPGHRTSPGLQDILDAEGGPTYRQVEYWVDKGWLKPDRNQSEGARILWSWPPREQRVAILMGRLFNAGLRPEVAAQVPENTYVWSGRPGRRMCRACRRGRSLAHYHATAAKARDAA